MPSPLPRRCLGLALTLAASLALPPRAPLAAQGAAASAGAPAPATRRAVLDGGGVIRWADTGEEVALFGANYTLPSASDYRAAGHVTRDRKRLIDEDVAHFARMGWDGLRISFWGDWENSDRAGNLLENEHLDLMDYLIAKARERGIYILFSPITTYSAVWPDALHDTTSPGFAAHFRKSELGTNPAAIAAQVNYIRQILEHVNPYTGTALKDEPSILFVEMINEPAHHSRDTAGSVAYIDALVGAVRATGSRQITFHNVSQDFAITPAIRRSTVQGVSFGWYPTGLNSGRELEGSYLRSVDAYPPMLGPELAGLPRVVYEFDVPDTRAAELYPAMTRAFRAVGAQFAAMFAYDMLATASRNLGWQTHYLNLVYTPRKAMSAVIAAEAMRRLPRYRDHGPYPQNTRFGPFRVSHEENLAEMVTDDAFLHAGTTRTAPPRPERLRRLAGYGSSPVVAYEGEGVWFLDRIRAGVWRLEVYPDAVPVDDPFEMPSPGKLVTRAVARAWPMEIRLPDLGPTFTVAPIAGAPAATGRAVAGRFTVRPGVYILGARGPVDRATLPEWVGRVRLNEYHAPAPDTLPVHVELLGGGERLAGRPIEIGARVVDAEPPDSVVLSIRPVGSWFRRYVMRPAGGYEHRVTIPADSSREGLHELVVTVIRGSRAVTFPERRSLRAWDWDYHGERFWTAVVASPRTPLRLFTPAEDVSRLAFTRVGDGGRSGIFRVVPSSRSGAPAFRLELPQAGADTPEDYTASLVVKDRIASRGASISGATRVSLQMRGLGARQTLHVTLVERDGTSWSARIVADSAWGERTLSLGDFAPARSVLLPQGFPGRWSYWVGPAAGRGGAGDRPRMADVERLQLSLRREEGTPRPAPESYGVEIESVALGFAP